MVVQWLSFRLRVWDFAKFYQYTIAVPSSPPFSQGEKGLFTLCLWEKGGDGVALALGHEGTRWLLANDT